MIDSYPKLRQLDYQPYQHEGQQVWLLHDPWQLSNKQLVLPPLLAQMTLYCDGSHDLAGIRQLLLDRFGVELPAEVLAATIQQLDNVLLLDNERSQRARQALGHAYRAQAHRPPALTPHSYPSDPQALSAFLDAYGEGDDPLEAAAEWHGQAVVSPHIDYQRGGEVYAKVWKRAEHAVQTADLVLLFATDHRGGLGSVTLTQVPYATPYGVLPTDPRLVEALAEAIGPDEAYALELNHRHEHSVELSAVWLHHALRGQTPPPMVPLLIGSFHHFVAQDGHPSQDEAMMAFVQTLLAETQGRRVLCVASVDLAHVGPAFDDDYIMDEARRAALVTSDHSLMEAVLTGDAERFYGEIAAVGDANKVCGFSPLYLMLRYLNGRAENALTGHQVAYAHCAADAADQSLVSICGLLLG